MTLRLEIEVEYSLEDGSDIPEEMLEELKSILLRVADNAASVGSLSSNSDAEVDSWVSRVVRMVH
jgi:hypothetical protein